MTAGKKLSSRDQLELQKAEVTGRFAQPLGNRPCTHFAICCDCRVRALQLGQVRRAMEEYKLIGVVCSIATTATWRSKPHLRACDSVVYGGEHAAMLSRASRDEQNATVVWREQADALRLAASKNGNLGTKMTNGINKLKPLRVL